MKVQFDEGPAAINLDEVGRVERGAPADVSKELGKQLLEQGWREVGAKKKTVKKAAKKKAAAQNQKGDD